MCRALIATGERVMIATTDADGRGRLPVGTGTTGEFDGVPTVFFHRRAGESAKWSPALASWLRAHVRDFDAVHVHAIFSHASVAAGRACRLAGIPYIVRPLGSLDPWSLRQHKYRKRLLLALAVRRMLREAAAIHYTSQEERRLAESGFLRLAEGHVVPLGVDEEFFEDRTPGLRPDHGTVLIMSRLHEKKGVDLVIRAFHEAVQHGGARTWRLVIAGDGATHYVDRLKRLALDGPARDRIGFNGWVDRGARRDLLRNASLLALASHQENFGIAAVEAMACGVPVMAAPGVNLAAEIAREGAGWVVERTVGAWRSTLAAALEDCDRLARMGQRARVFAGRFRWPVVAAQLRALYGEIAVRHAGAHTPAPLRTGWEARL
jgi:glycosyltransferase involved in cell wall biosynthesis